MPNSPPRFQALARESSTVHDVVPRRPQAQQATELAAAEAHSTWRKAEIKTTTFRTPAERARQLAFAPSDAPNNAPGMPANFEACSEYGRVEFPASSRPPAKWAKISPATDENAMADIVQLLMKAWHLPAPSVLISVTGGASSLDLNDQQKLVFRRGLLQAAKRASSGGSGEDGEMAMAPWLITGGTNSGVMELVGRTMHGLEADVNPPIPCIGIAPWGIISQRSHMSAARRSAYAATAGDSADGASASKKRSRLGARYVYGSKADDVIASEHEKNWLDANHTHFLLVDNGSAGREAYGSEINLRSSLMGHVCNQCFGVDEDGDPLPKPPFVLLVLGGGPNTYSMVLETLMKARPVVCMPDSGGAALAIYQFVCFGHAGTELDSSDSVAYETARNLLPQIKTWGEREMGANREKQLTFFSTEGDVLASNDLGTTILSSILSDCDRTVDAINLAVRWRDTDIIRAQLDESQEVDASGETPQ